MPTDKDRTWTSLYKGAMLEFDPQRLRKRTSLANNAIKTTASEARPFR
jgi:hypothetical protein